MFGRHDLALVLADVGERPDAGRRRRSPTAPRAARSCASTGMPWRVGLDADRLEADALDARAPAGGHEQAVAAQLATVVELEDVVLAVAPGRGRARRRATSSMPSRRRTSPSASPSGAGSRGEHVVGALDAAPPRRPAGAPPAPARRRPARRRARAAGAGSPSCAVASRLVQTPSSSRRPGIGGMIGSAPLATTMCSAVWRTPSTSTDARAGEPARAAEQVDAVVGQPALLRRRRCSFETMKSRQASAASTSTSARGGRLARLVHRLARPQQRLRRDAGPVRALAADQLALDDRDAQPALGQLARAVLARASPPPSDDHVVVRAHRLSVAFAPGRCARGFPGPCPG